MTGLVTTRLWAPEAAGQQLHRENEAARVIGMQHVTASPLSPTVFEDDAFIIPE